MFTQIKVSSPEVSQVTEVKSQDGADSTWRYIRIAYPNGVTITVPSTISPEIISRYIYLK